MRTWTTTWSLFGMTHIVSLGFCTAYTMPSMRPNPTVSALPNVDAHWPSLLASSAAESLASTSIGAAPASAGASASTLSGMVVLLDELHGRRTPVAAATAKKACRMRPDFQRVSGRGPAETITTKTLGRAYHHR